MVAIKDFGMPSCCENCNMCDNRNLDTFYCCITLNDVNIDEKAHDCPLVEIEERKTENCTDCKEYNKEKHYCPKFCDVIRDTTKEMQEFYKGEHEKLERIEQVIKELNCYYPLDAINEIENILKQE